MSRPRRGGDGVYRCIIQLSYAKFAYKERNERSNTMNSAAAYILASASAAMQIDIEMLPRHRRRRCLRDFRKKSCSVLGSRAKPRIYSDCKTWENGRNSALFGVYHLLFKETSSSRKVTWVFRKMLEVTRDSEEMKVDVLHTVPLHLFLYSGVHIFQYKYYYSALLF